MSPLDVMVGLTGNAVWDVISRVVVDRQRAEADPRAALQDLERALAQAEATANAREQAWVSVVRRLVREQAIEALDSGDLGVMRCTLDQILDEQQALRKANAQSFWIGLAIGVLMGIVGIAFTIWTATWD